MFIFIASWRVLVLKAFVVPDDLAVNFIIPENDIRRNFFRWFFKPEVALLLLDIEKKVRMALWLSKWTFVIRKPPTWSKHKHLYKTKDVAKPPYSGTCPTRRDFALSYVYWYQTYYILVFLKSPRRKLYYIDEIRCFSTNLSHQLVQNCLFLTQQALSESPSLLYTL